MKKILCLLFGVLFFMSCTKEEQLNDELSDSFGLSQEDIVLKSKLNDAAIIVSNIITDPLVYKELLELTSNKDGDNQVSFKQIFTEDASKGAGLFLSFKKSFLSETNKKGSIADLENLTSYLIDNDCYLYCPYPEEFYPEGIKTLTVAAHPIDNEFEGVGYVLNGSKSERVLVNEDYADRHPVLLIMPKDELIIEDDPGAGGTGYEPPVPTNPNVKIHEVKVGKFWCAYDCSGLFEGDYDIHILRGEAGSYNVIENTLDKGNFPVDIPFKYPRKYAKAARRGWNKYCNGGWYNVNTVWESDWSVDKVQQAIFIYEYDQKGKISVSAVVKRLVKVALDSVGDLSKELTLSGSVESEFKGTSLGLSEWNRDWFYITNRNKNLGDPMKDGVVIRQTNPQVKFTMYDRVLQY
ncbi:MAG TPA: hypothetical protein PLC17_10855 [Tenuifilaceae bacterium]|nr:hypothetical protein [Tenuifilaceae bacterium]